MTEDVKDIIEKKKDFISRVDRFPIYVQSELQLVWRYFRNITESTELLGRCAEVEVNKRKIICKLTDGYYVNEDDLFAIYDSLSKVIDEAKELLEIQSNMPYPHRKEVSHG